MNLVLNKPINISLQSKLTTVVDGFPSQDGAWDIIYFQRIENGVASGQIYRLGKCIGLDSEPGIYLGGQFLYTGNNLSPWPGATIGSPSFTSHSYGTGDRGVDWTQNILSHYQGMPDGSYTAVSGASWIGANTRWMLDTDSNIHNDEGYWEIGKEYYYSITVSGVTAGNFELYVCGSYVRTISENGTYTGVVSPVNYHRSDPNPNNPNAGTITYLYENYYGMSIHNTTNFDGTIGDVLVSERFNLQEGMYRLHVSPDATAQTPDPGDFVFFGKNNEIGTAGVTGYYAAVEMKNDSIDYVELFAVSSEVTQSSK